MPIKSRLTNEIANAFPLWTKVQSDDQSLGKNFINAFALQLEPLVTELYKAEKNVFLTTASCNEIDITYNFTLPNSFEFSSNEADSLNPSYYYPTISGYQNDEWHEVLPIETGSIKDFWYENIPSRISTELIGTENNLLASGVSTDIELTLVDSGLLIPNRLLIQVDGHNLVRLDTRNNLLKSRVRITGLTWKDTEETEDVIFLYSEERKSNKVWKEIYKIQPVDFPADCSINVYKNSFNRTSYIDAFDTLSQFSDSRENLPLFWGLSTASGILQSQRFSSLRAIDLIKQKPSIIPYEEWNLLDSGNNQVNLLDISTIENQQRLFGITESGLFLYDTLFETVNIKNQQYKNPDSYVSLEFSSDNLIKDEELEVSVVFSRPIKTIIKHRLKIKYPDGSEFGILEDGSLISTSSDYWVYRETADRFIRQSFFIELEDFGEHIFTLECMYLDQTIHITQRAALVQKKKPLAQFELSGINDSITGVDIDHLGQLYVQDQTGSIHKVNLHYDNYLVDFNNKELVFRENYSEIKVVK